MILYEVTFQRRSDGIITCLTEDIEDAAGNVINKLTFKLKSGQNIDAVIKEYLSAFNSKDDKGKCCNTPKCVFKVLLAYHHFTDIVNNYSKCYHFGQNELIGLSSNRNYKLPIIHITALDIFDSEVIRKFKINKRYANIIDSSIWNYYVPIEFNKDKQYIFTRLCSVLKKIAENECFKIVPTENNKLIETFSLYELAITHEYADLNARLMNNAYLISEHGEAVSPFLFHSEQKMTLSSVAIVNELQKLTNNKKIKRRILFLDDHCNDNLSYCIPKKHSKINKKDIILKRLEEVANLHGSKWEDLFELHCIEELSELSILEEKKFDIILVDYLLKKKEENIREYGYQILEKIKNNTIKNAKGPIGKYWIMFTSAFTSAVQERLLAEGYSYSDKNWYIGRTACPTTTPELFKYNLLSLMKRQFDYITEINERKEILNKDDNKRRVVTLIDYLNILFKESKNVRIKALENFNSLLHLRAHYDILKRDFYMGGKDNPDAEKNGSPLVQALFPDIKHYSNAFWEHTQHLIYLIAFGNIRQWNEMWDEYIFIKDILRKAIVDGAESKPKNQDNQNEQDNLVRKIEKYIIEIKNTNHR